MKNKKLLGFLGLVVLIILVIALDHYSNDSEAEGEAVGPAPVYSVPRDFDWETYLQNNPDLGPAGINTEEKAKKHWEEYGKKEGRNYHRIHPPKPPEPVPQAPAANARSADAAAIDAAMSTNMERLATLRSVSRVSLDPPSFNPVKLRERYNKIMERAGVKTKEEAMDFSLAFWEKKRKAYFL